jgi:DUF1680 family protein
MFRLRLLPLSLLAAALFAGDWSSRVDLTLHRIAEGGPPRYDDAFILADLVPRDGRRFTEFSGDVSGRYIGALAAISASTGERFPALDRVVSEALKLQRADGHFGAPLSTGAVTDRDMATMWGNGRLLIGLLEYYDLTSRADVLAAARRLGDFLVSAGPRFNSAEVRRIYNGEKFAVGYICWTSTLEGVAGLYRITKDGRYLGLARTIAAATERYPSQHSHGYLSTLRGVVELYRVTGERRYLDQAASRWKGVIESGNRMVQGGVPEMFAPQAKRDEGCSEADWLRLSLDLWRMTRAPEYLREAELTLFNEMALNQFHTGDFGHHTLSARGITVPSARAWWCCTFHGLRAMADVMRSVFHADGETLSYDLPVDGRGEAAGFAVSAGSSLGRDATVRLTINTAPGGERAFRLRVPQWASRVEVAVNNEKVAADIQSGYATVRRAWKKGDEVMLRYTLEARTERHKSGQMAAVFYGPWLLGVDEAGSPNYFDEPSTRNVVTLAEKDGRVQLEPAPAGQGGAFSVPAAHFRLRYLPGGYAMQPQTALLRPIAEFTAGPDNNQVEFWLPVAR